MSSEYGLSKYSNSALASGGAYKMYYEIPHGCDMEIKTTSSGSIKHIYNTTPSYPKIRSYPDGIKVGCTFITTEAVEKIYQWHKNYLSNKEGTHQN